MSSPGLEAYLARLFTDAEERERFLREGTAPAGLSDAERASLAGIDRVGLRMAAESYGAKRAARRKGWKERWFG